MCASSVNYKSQTCANSSGGQSPGFDPRLFRVRFVVDEAALRKCFIRSTTCCSYQQNEITVPSKKRTLLEI